MIRQSSSSDPINHIWDVNERTTLTKDEVSGVTTELCTTEYENIMV